jgi:ABC-type multidrug transport system fused ATPase/permease subunit
MTQKNPLWRCLALYKEMPWRFSITALLFISLNAGLAWQQWLIGRAVNDVQRGHAVVRLPGGGFDLAVLQHWVLLIVGVAVARGVLQYIAGVCALVIGQELLFILRQRILLQVQRLDLAYHWRHGVGEIVTRTTRDADKVRDALINFWRQVFESALVLLAAVGLLAWYSPWLGLVPLLLTLSGISIFVAQTNTLVTLDRAVGAAYDRVNQDLSEGVNGVRVIKSFALEQRRVDIFSGHVAAFVQHARTALAYSSTHIPLPQLVVASSHIWILGFGAHLVQQGELNVGELIASLLVANTLVFRIEGVGRVMQVFADARASAARIWDLLDAEAVIRSGTAAMPDGPLGLKLDGVSAYAPNGDTAILDRCDLEVAPGEVVALVGPTGSGKSTLAGLLSRLLEHAEGRVSIGSPWAGWQDVRSLQLDTLRRKVHVVPQEAFLFSDTLDANLRLGNPQASDEEVWQALEFADARGFVERLPDGLHTRMGDRGVTLSGGQRQRICLARAMLARPAILVLDDATSALDALTERHVLDHVRKLRADSGYPITVVLIASKLSTLLLADRVAMLSRGHIAAEGTHAALMHSNAEYRDLLGEHHGH